MISRRILAHLRNQQWTAIAIDFLIVVAGVFVGIQAANLNGERIDRRLEQEYRGRLLADLDAILDNAANQLEFETNKSREVAGALALSALPPSEDKARRLGQALVATTIRLSPNFESPTFNDLQNSGRLSLIRDPALRRDLSTYFARLQYLRGAIGRNNDNFAEPFVDYLRSQNIGSGFTDADSAAGVPLAAMEQRIARVALKRFGPRDIGAHSTNLNLPVSAPFWEGLRSNLSWRGQGAAANENLLNLITAEARAMKREVENS